MTQQRSEAPRLRANLARSGKGLGLAPTSNFLWFDRRENHKKCATVATVALLAVYGYLQFILNQAAQKKESQFISWRKA